MGAHKGRPYGGHGRLPPPHARVPPPHAREGGHPHGHLATRSTVPEGSRALGMDPRLPPSTVIAAKAAIQGGGGSSEWRCDSRLSGSPRAREWGVMARVTSTPLMLGQAQHERACLIPLTLSLSKGERIATTVVFPLWFDRLTMSGREESAHPEPVEGPAPQGLSGRMAGDDRVRSPRACRRACPAGAERAHDRRRPWFPARLTPVSGTGRAMSGSVRLSAKEHNPPRVPSHRRGL